MLLWDFLEVEAKEAETLEQGLVIQIDANAHLGPTVLKGDPNLMNPNGKMFAEFLEQHPAITVVNRLDLCEGLITRKRSTIKGVEESVLDFFLVNQNMSQYLTKMRIDEEEQYSLTNISQKKLATTTTKSDHRTLILDLNLNFRKIKPDAKEFFNFKSETCQENFKLLTDNETNLIDCLKTNISLDEKAKIWLKNLDTVFHKSFSKIKIKNSRKKSDSEENKLLEERRTLLRKVARNPSDIIIKRISEIEEKLCKTNFQSASSHMAEQLTLAAEDDSTRGTRSAWSIYRKIRPRHKPVVPVGKKDKKGHIVSNHVELKKLYLNTFVWRLRERPSHPKMIELHIAKENMFQTILKLCKMTPSNPWQMYDLENVLKVLKKDKCRDPYGLVNEIFSTHVAGTYFKTSLLMLFNEIKKNKKIPHFMKVANISAIYKGKGSMNDLKN